MFKKIFIRIVLVSVIILLFSKFSLAATYYIKPAGSDSNDGLSIANAWQTISKANSTLTAGDTVEILGGTYSGSSNQIKPVNDGTSWVNMITYQNYGDGTVNLTYSASYSSGEGCANLGGRQYIKLQGLRFYAAVNQERAISLDGASYILLEDLNIDGNWNRGISIHRKLDPTAETHHIIIRNVDIVGGNPCTTGTGTGFPYEGFDITRDAHHILIEDSDLSNIQHTLIYFYRDLTGSSDRPYNIVVRNNTLDNSVHSGLNMAWQDDGHNWSLVENNYIVQSGDQPNSCGQDYPGDGFQTSGSHTMYRYNKGKNSGYDAYGGATATTAMKPNSYMSGGTYAVEATNIIIYNNTFANNRGLGFYGRQSNASAAFSDNVVVNNILVDNLTSYDFELYYRLDGSTDPCDEVRNNLIATAAGTVIGHSSGFDSGNYTISSAESTFNDDCPTDPIKYSNNIYGDPKLNDVANGDFTLRSGSAAIDAGGYLTQVAAADSGSGTSLIVDDARFFQDGLGMTGSPFNVQADWIAVGTVSNVVRISSINYSTDTITLANSISRNDGDPVWLYKDSDGTRVLYGSAPDVGAHEMDLGTSEPPSPPAGLKIN